MSYFENPATAIGCELIWLATAQHRPPNWRWRLGKHLAVRKSWVPQYWLDDWIRLAACLHCKAAGKRRNEGKLLLSRFPGAIAAFDIYHRNAFQRWELEARLLAGESFDTIAQKCETKREVVDVYHEVFYCVQPFLGTGVHTMTVAIDETIHSGLAEDDVDLLLKYYGYLRGPIFLDVLVDYYRHPPVVPRTARRS